MFDYHFTNILIIIIIKIKLILAQCAVISSASYQMIIIAPISPVTPLVSVVMAVEDTMEKEPMGKIWRKTILEPDDESGVKQMLL